VFYKNSVVFFLSAESSFACDCPFAFDYAPLLVTTLCFWLQQAGPYAQQQKAKGNAKAKDEKAKGNATFVPFAFAFCLCVA
jgi:hypothetical protein